MVKCKIGFIQQLLGNGHKWEFLKRTHYKYRGPVTEYFKRCVKCGHFEEYVPWSHEKRKWDEKCTEIASKSSC